jgi:hypothetical protein
MNGGLSTFIFAAIIVAVIKREITTIARSVSTPRTRSSTYSAFKVRPHCLAITTDAVIDKRYDIVSFGTMITALAVIVVVLAITKSKAASISPWGPKMKVTRRAASISIIAIATGRACALFSLLSKVRTGCRAIYFRRISRMRRSSHVYSHVNVDVVIGTHKSGLIEGVPATSLITALIARTA